MTEDVQEITRPRFFVRVIETPAGSPWDQAQAARLDALHGSPLPADQLLMQLRRVEAWRPSAAGKFAVAYCRSSDLVAEETHLAAVAGRRVRFVFGPPGRVGDRTKKAISAGLLIISLSTALAFAGSRAFEARTANDTLLAQLERNAQLHEHRQRKVRQIEAELRRLRNLRAADHSFSALATDLAWLGQAKSGGASIQRVVWLPGEMQITSLGPDIPILGGERAVEAGGTEIAGASTWRIGSGPAPVVRGGVTRPNVVGRPSVASSTQP